MSSGRLSPLENELYKKVKGSRDQTISGSALTQGHNRNDTVGALNGLMSKNLIMVKHDDKGNAFFTAVSKDEAKKTGALEENEKIAYSAIKGAGNTGIWIRNIKTATNLAPAVLNKVIRSLEKRALIKTVKSIKAPTKKLYMLAELSPSAELTGGPFYDGHNIDVGLISDLSQVAFRYVLEKSFPRKIPKRPTIPDDIYVPNPIYAPSHTSKLPSPKAILDYLVKHDVIKIKLEVEHIIQIMSMLAYEGRVEIIKPIRLHDDAGWNSDLENDGGAADEDELKKIKAERAKAGKKRTRSERGSDSEVESSDDERARKKSKKDKKSKEKRKAEKKKRKKEKEKRDRKKRRDKKRAKKEESDSDMSGNNSDELVSVNEVSKKKKKKKSKRKDDSSASSSSSSSDSSDSGSDSSDSDSESDSSDSSSSSSDKKKKKSRKAKEEVLPGSYLDVEDPSTGMADGMGGVFSFHGQYDPFTDPDVVYRAVRPSRFNWPVNEAPCGLCPIQKFCAEAGPVNPIDCNYYDQWEANDNFELKLGFNGDLLEI